MTEPDIAHAVKEILGASLSFCRGSRVEGSRSRARVPCRGSRVTFFFPKFFFFGKGNNRCIKKNKKNLKKQMAREHLVGIEKSSETSQFVFEELHL